MGLSGDNTNIRDLMDLKPADVADSQQSARQDLDATNKASAILRKGGDCAYEKAQRALLPDTREWWQEYVDDEEYTADATGLPSLNLTGLTPGLVFLMTVSVSGMKSSRSWYFLAIPQSNTPMPSKIPPLGIGLQYPLLDVRKQKSPVDRGF